MMLKSPSRPFCCGLLIKAAALLLFTFQPVEAALQWNRHTNGTYSWSTGTNWMNGTAPGLAEDQEIILKDTTSTTTSTSIAILLDIEEDEQILTGGLTFTGYNNWSNPFTLNLDLNEKRLILDGGRLSFIRESGTSVKSNTLAFTNGTLQVGTASHAATIDLGRNYASSGVSTAAQANVLKVGIGATFDSVNIDSLHIASNLSNFTHQYTFDLSEATLVSGTQERTLKVANSISIGAALQTSFNGSNKKQGELKLGDLSLLQTNDLAVGQSLEVTAIETLDRTSTGILRFAANQTTALEMNVTRDFRIGVGKNAIGEVLDAPQELHLTVGTALTPVNERGVLFVGYKNLSGTTFNRTKDTTSGKFVAQEGSFNAYLRELKVGVNDYTVGTVEGILDLSEMDLGRLEVTGDAVVGRGVDAVGHLALSGGTVASSNLVLGTATQGVDPDFTLTRSSLSLDNTLWTIDGTLTIGAMGDLELRLGSGLAGLDIGLALDLQSGGTLAIHFDANASESVLWGLRIAGDHETLLNGYIGSDRLLALGEFGSQAFVFKDDQYTYYGIVAIPEPATLALCSLGLLGILALRLRRRLTRRAPETSHT